MPGIKVVLVTGGSSGIGFAIAKRFIGEGFKTIITGRDEKKLREAARILPGNCDAQVFDMAWLDQIPVFVSGLKEKYGAIDILVNNAGINQKKPMTEVSDEDFNNIITTNQTGVFVMSREVANVMLTQDTRGVIIHISSMAAHYAIPKIISYTAAKSAVEGMTRAMALELSPHGIRVNCVAPGYISTPMTDKAFEGDPERKHKVLSRTPMGRLGEPDEIANAVYFLASDEASFITGEVLKVDGGNSIGF